MTAYDKDTILFNNGMQIELTERVCMKSGMLLHLRGHVSVGERESLGGHCTGQRPRETLSSNRRRGYCS